MGDTKRFSKFADLIDVRFKNKELKIADVASGNGQLQQELRRRGFRNVVSWDKRKRNAKNRQIYRYGYFTSSCKDSYDLVVGLHPDEATDHIILYAIKNRIPFIICPCCIKPSATNFNDRPTFENWIIHLERLANSFNIYRHYLKMSGKNLVIIGYPRLHKGRRNAK